MSLIGISGKIGSGKDTVADMIRGVDADFRDQVIFDCLGSLDGDAWLNDSEWQVKRFADKLKDIACMLVGCTRDQLENREFKEKPLGEEWWYWKVFLDVEFKHYNMIPYNGESNIYEALGETPDEYAGHILVKLTPRKLMQLLGTEAGRDIIHPDIWVNALFADYIERIGTKGNALSDHPKLRALGIKQILPEYPKWIIPDTRFPNEAKAIKDKNGILIRVIRPSYKAKKFSETEKHPSETALDYYEEWDYVINNNGTLEDLLKKVKYICKQENII